MNDLRTRLPECRLEYQVPHIPASHTALVIEINAADIEWQEKMLPWTLAGLINNTDIVMKGVHLYVACEDGTQERIRTALKKIDLPPGTLITKDAEHTQPLILFGHYGHRYDSVCILDVNYWAFRGIGKRQEADIKLPFGHVLRYTWNWAVANYSLRVENDIYLKDTWVGLSKPGCLTGGDSPRHQKRLAGALIGNLVRTRRKPLFAKVPVQKVTVSFTDEGMHETPTFLKNAHTGYTLPTLQSMAKAIKSRTQTSLPISSMKLNPTGTSMPLS